MIRGIGSIAVTVSDRKMAAAWYREKLGFDVQGNLEGHWVTVAPPNTSIVIHLCETKPLEPGNTGISMEVDDIEATCRELERRGVEFTKELTRASWGTYAMIKDPDGNEYWLMPSEA